MIIAPRFIAPPVTPVEDHTLFAQRRAAIDEIATTRAKVIRFGLFGTADSTCQCNMQFGP
jgi:hypothetical protein